MDREKESIIQKQEGDKQFKVFESSKFFILSTFFLIIETLQKFCKIISVNIRILKILLRYYLSINYLKI